MSVVEVRQVRMSVPHRLVHVLVDVGLGAFVAMVRVLVVFIVHMAVIVRHVLVPVLVRVPLGQHEPGRDHHQGRGGDEADRHGLAEQWHRERCADERRGAEMRAGSRGAKVAQRVYEENQAHAVSEESQRE
jgi:hypothetical protein